MVIRNERQRRGAWSLLALGLIVLGSAACQPVVESTTPTTTTTTPTPTAPPPPALSKATCPAGGTITVATTIVADVRDLLAAAKTAGLSLCGGGYRSSDAQVALREANCGTSYYAIYEMPASQCTPPTAIPGRSMHEKGLAVDFNNCSTRTTACYVWLAKNASRFDLINLPSEPWHWSTNGN